MPIHTSNNGRTPDQSVEQNFTICNCSLIHRTLHFKRIIGILIDRQLLNKSLFQRFDYTGHSLPKWYNCAQKYTFFLNFRVKFLVIILNVAGRGNSNGEKVPKMTCSAKASEAKRIENLFALVPRICKNSQASGNDYVILIGCPKFQKLTAPIKHKSGKASTVGCRGMFLMTNKIKNKCPTTGTF